MMDAANSWELKDALKECRRNLEIAQNQLNDLKNEVMDVHDIEFDSLQSRMPHNFLKIPDPPVEQNVEKDFIVIIETLKKYQVIINQMISEIPEGIHENFKETLEDAKIKLQQLKETFVIVQTLIGNSNDEIDSALPELPNDINTARSRSARSIRDVLAVREYEKLLNNHIENTLILYEV